MQVAAHSESVRTMEADAVVIAVPQGEDWPQPACELNELSAGLLTRLIETGEFRGKTGDTLLLRGLSGIAADVVCLVGTGDDDSRDRGVAFRAAAAAAKTLASHPRSKVAYCWGDDWQGDLCTDGIAGAIVGCHGQDLHKSEKRLHPFETLLWQGADQVAAGTAVGKAMNFCRDLVNGAPSDINPQGFVEAVVPLASEAGIITEIWDEHRLAEERCGALLAVSRGSDAAPRLMKLQYRGDSSAQVPALTLVGKGVTFDSGGYSIKPSDGMKTMKCDMAGAATVIGTLLAIAHLQLPLRVDGVVGLVENLVSGRAYKLGDVLTTRNGTTIEVLNTDAEGRLVLADALDVAISDKPQRLVDLATLTGACVVALGTDTAGLMTNNDSWCDQIADAAERCGEPVWKLPMFDFYGDLIRSQVADIKNIGEGRWAGASTAAKLLEHFVGDVPWTHIDIAGPSFLDRPKSWIDAGGTACMVRTLIEVARDLALTA